MLFNGRDFERLVVVWYCELVAFIVHVTGSQHVASFFFRPVLTTPLTRMLIMKLSIGGHM